MFSVFYCLVWARTESPCTRIDPLIVIIYFVLENTSHVLIIHYSYNLHLHNTNTTQSPGQMVGTTLPLTRAHVTSATSRRGEERGERLVRGYRSGGSVFISLEDCHQLATVLLSSAENIRIFSSALKL